MVFKSFVAHGGTPFQVLINHSLCTFLHWLIGILFLTIPGCCFQRNLVFGRGIKGDYSYSRNSIEDDSLVFTATGSTTVLLKSIEDVTVTAGTFEDCLKIFTSQTEQRSDGWTLELEDTAWYAHKVGLIKEEIIQTLHHPVEEDSDRTDILELISATVDGMTYE